LPLAPRQLFTFHDANLVYAMGHYDVRISQPHAPGCPPFVLAMRILHRLRFKRGAGILLVLAMAGSITALGLLVLIGNRIFGGDPAFRAAWILLLHTVFWHTGVTSALAVVCLTAAACCPGAWLGNGQGVKWNSMLLAIGAGIGAETGPLRLPQWGACALQVLLAPIPALNRTFFHYRGCYYTDAAVPGMGAAAEQAWADINPGFPLTSVQADPKHSGGGGPHVTRGAAAERGAARQRRYHPGTRAHVQEEGGVPRTGHGDHSAGA
jgi:hypothetical protein